MIKNLKIESNRLIIRPYMEADLVECFQLMQNKELFNYLDMEVMSFEEYK
jgi:[ribosomal protein S5]-alanine N-acetyltransferase